MFKKLLSSIGIGSAKVDTIVKTNELYPMSVVDLEILIEGGNTEQDLNGLTLALCTSAKSEVEMDDVEFDVNNTITLSNWQVPLEKSVIGAGEKMTIECQIEIHPETPITEFGGTNSRVWIATGLDIDNGLDSSDKDFLTILAPDFQRNALAAIEDMGYNLQKIDTESGKLRGGDFESSIGCYQEFEFKGSSGLFGTKEIEISFVQYEDSVGIVLEIDRSFGGDTYHSVLAPINADYEQIKDWIKDHI